MVPSLLVRTRVTGRLNGALRFNLSPIMFKTHRYKQSFFLRKINLWNSLPKTSVFLKIIIWFYLRKDATPTSFLDRVILDYFIGDLPNISTSSYPLIYFLKSCQNFSFKRQHCLELVLCGWCRTMTISIRCLSMCLISISCKYITSFFIIQT